MSIFGKKADDVYRQGVLERGSFEPIGAPKNIYLFWKKHTKDKRKTENFCHFWRVVAIWAPLMFLRVKTLQALQQTRTWYALAALYVTAAVVLGAVFTWAWPIALLGLPYAVFTLVATFIALDDSEGEYDEPMTPGWKVEGNETLFKVMLFAPLSFALYWIIVGGILLIGNGIVWVGDHVNFHTINNALDKAWYLIRWPLAAAAVVGLGYLATLLTAEFGWGLWLYSLGLIVVIAVAIAGMLWLADIADQRQAAKRAEKNARHDAWLEGKLTDEEYFGATPSPDLPRWLEWSLGKIAAFFIGVKDFAVLALNVVRVNKWKICPTVKVD